LILLFLPLFLFCLLLLLFLRLFLILLLTLLYLSLFLFCLLFLLFHLSFFRLLIVLFLFSSSSAFYSSSSLFYSSACWSFSVTPILPLFPFISLLQFPLFTLPKTPRLLLFSSFFLFSSSSLPFHHSTLWFLFFSPYYSFLLAIQLSHFLLFFSSLVSHSPYTFFALSSITFLLSFFYKFFLSYLYVLSWLSVTNYLLQLNIFEPK
jgi:hypothetical protein